MYTKFPIFLSNWMLLFVTNNINSYIDVSLTIEFAFIMYTHTCADIFIII